MSSQVIEAPTIEPGSSPVFVDSTGRRARLAKRAAWTLAACCVGYLAVFGVSLAAGPVSPMVPIGRFPELIPMEAGPVETASPTSRTARGDAVARARSTATTGAVAPPPATAPTPATPATPTPAPTAATTSGEPTPTSSAVPPTTESPVPTTSADPTDPSTTEPAPTSTETAGSLGETGPSLGLDAQPGVDTGGLALGGAA